MAFRKSNPAPSRASRFRELICSELELGSLASELANELSSKDWVLLEGPMGAGKSTFARAVLESLRIDQPPEGSPTFAIAHEYTSSRIPSVVHIDLYRIRSGSEIDEAGIPSYFWERDAAILVEWASMWPDFESALKSGNPRGRIWEVSLDFDPEDSLRRKVTIHQIQ